MGIERKSKNDFWLGKNSVTKSKLYSKQKILFKSEIEVIRIITLSIIISAFALAITVAVVCSCIVGGRVDKEYIKFKRKDW